MEVLKLAKILTSPITKVICYIFFVVGVAGLILCGVDIKNVSNITTLISGSLSSVSSILIQVINSVKNKLPSEPKG